MKSLVLFVALIVSSVATAAPMRFEWGGSNGRCEGCGPFIQADGDITPQTPADFQRFLRSQPSVAGVIRLHSDGGDLAAGLALGVLIRQAGLSTEVGADKLNREWLGSDRRRMSERIPGLCASACAYAFLGGVKRTIEEGSRIGFHRFYKREAVAQPSVKQFTGDDLDSTQRALAGLLLYTIEMGVDARLVALASDAGAGEMRWLTPAEASDLKVAYQPEAWKPWRIEAYKDSIEAISETADGQIRMVAHCSRQHGFQVVLTDRTQDGDEWFKQVKGCAGKRGHPVFGTFVDGRSVGIFKTQEGAGIVFVLPHGTPPLTSPALLDADPYPMACRSERYQGSTVNFAPAVRLAFRNCLP
jgi:Predicted periplasmic protein